MIMPELKCTVQTCVHNTQFLCALDSIVVGGDEAKNPKETRCDSFQERKSEGMMQGYKSGSVNAVGEAKVMASDRSKIDCKAVECVYNESCKCEAGKISVEGSNACQKEGTECATFTCR